MMTRAGIALARSADGIDAIKCLVGDDRGTMASWLAGEYVGCKKKSQWEKEKKAFGELCCNFQLASQPGSQAAFSSSLALMQHRRRRRPWRKSESEEGKKETL